MLAYAGKIGVIKCVEYYDVCREAKRLNPNIVTIARTLNTNYGMIDGPPDWLWGDPAAWWAGIKDRLPDGFDYYEVINEVGGPPQGDEYWAQWSIEIAKLVARDKGGAYLAFSFAPGNPTYDRWPKLVAYLRWAEDNPLPNGRHHGVALHQSAFAPFNKSDSPWINEAHIAGRHRLVRDVLLANTGFDLALSHIPLALTEIGVTDGYSGNWEAVWSDAEKGSAYRETVRQHQADGWAGPRLLLWWNIGQIGKWTSDHAALPHMLP